MRLLQTKQTLSDSSQQRMTRNRSTITSHNTSIYKEQNVSRNAKCDSIGG